MPFDADRTIGPYFFKVGHSAGHKSPPICNPGSWQQRTGLVDVPLLAGNVETPEDHGMLDVPLESFSSACMADASGLGCRSMAAAAVVKFAASQRHGNVRWL
jgi:hypothetical protein